MIGAARAGAGARQKANRPEPVQVDSPVSTSTNNPPNNRKRRGLSPSTEPRRLGGASSASGTSNASVNLPPTLSPASPAPPAPPVSPPNSTTTSPPLSIPSSLRKRARSLAQDSPTDAPPTLSPTSGTEPAAAEQPAQAAQQRIRQTALIPQSPVTLPDNSQISVENPEDPRHNDLFAPGSYYSNRHRSVRIKSVVGGWGPKNKQVHVKNSSEDTVSCSSLEFAKETYPELGVLFVGRDKPHRYFESRSLLRKTLQRPYRYIMPSGEHLYFENHEIAQQCYPSSRKVNLPGGKIHYCLDPKTTDKLPVGSFYSDEEGSLHIKSDVGGWGPKKKQFHVLRGTLNQQQNTSYINSRLAREQNPGLVRFYARGLRLGYDSISHLREAFPSTIPYQNKSGIEVYFETPQIAQQTCSRAITCIGPEQSTITYINEDAASRQKPNIVSYQDVDGSRIWYDTLEIAQAECPHRKQGDDGEFYVNNMALSTQKIASIIDRDIPGVLADSRREVDNNLRLITSDKDHFKAFHNYRTCDPASFRHMRRSYFLTTEFQHVVKSIAFLDSYFLAPTMSQKGLALAQYILHQQQHQFDRHMSAIGIHEHFGGILEQLHTAVQTLSPQSDRSDRRVSNRFGSQSLSALKGLRKIISGEGQMGHHNQDFERYVSQSTPQAKFKAQTIMKVDPNLVTRLQEQWGRHVNLDTIARLESYPVKARLKEVVQLQSQLLSRVEDQYWPAIETGNCLAINASMKRYEPGRAHASLHKATCLESLNYELKSVLADFDQDIQTHINLIEGGQRSAPHSTAALEASRRMIQFFKKSNTLIKHLQDLYKRINDDAADSLSRLENDDQ